MLKMWPFLLSSQKENEDFGVWYKTCPAGRQQNQITIRYEDVIDSQLAIIQNNDKHFLKILEHLLPDFPH